MTFVDSLALSPYHGWVAASAIFTALVVYW